MKKKFFSSILVVFCCVFSLFARTLTLDEALELCIENNPDLKKQRLSLEDARRRNNNMWNKFLPSLSAGGSYTNSHDFSESSNWNWGVSAGASLSFSFSTSSEMQLLNLNYQSSLLSYENLLQTTKANISTSFYSLIAEQKNLEILLDSQKLAKEVYEQTLKNYRSGLSSELDMLNSKYSYLSIEPQVQEARSSFLSNLGDFALSLGITDVRDLTLQGELNSQKVNLPSPPEIVSTYLEGRYDVKAADVSLKQAKLNKWTTVSGNWLPSLSFSEKVTLSENGAASGTAIGNSGAGISGAFTASVSVPLSGLIPGSAESLNVKTQDDNVKTAEITASETRKQAKNDILTKFSNIERLWNSLEVAKMNESISKRSYELSTEGYNAGLVSQTDLESSRQKYVTSQQTVLQSQISYLSSLYSAASSINLSIEDFYKTFASSELTGASGANNTNGN